MKRLIIQSIFFLFPIILGSCFIDVFISTNLKKTILFAHLENPIWNDILEGKVNSDIVIYGSSRAMVHINPTMISDSLNISTYNLGLEGHNFWLQYLRHSLLLKNNKIPKLIIYSLDIFTLEKVEDLYNSEQFLPYMLWNDEIRNATISYNGYNLIDYEIPLIRYFGSSTAIITAIKSFTMPQYNNKGRIKGYQGQERTWNNDFDNVRKAMKYYEAKLDMASIILFDKFLSECKTNNIKIIFVYTPEYTEGQKFIKNRDEIIALYTKFSKKYNIPFYDYSNDTISFQKKYFYDSHHLNKSGAELFTNKLIVKLKSTNL